MISRGVGLCSFSSSLPAQCPGMKMVNALYLYHIPPETGMMLDLSIELTYILPSPAGSSLALVISPS